MTELRKKLECSGIGALVFLVASLPMLYTYTRLDYGCTTYSTKLIHMLVFFVLNLVAMHFFSNNMSLGLKVKYSIYGALVFFLLSSTEMYKLTNMTGLNTSTDGCPNMMGIVLHAVVYGAVLIGLMSLPKDDCKCA